jgi:hypothetical protein
MCHDHVYAWHPGDGSECLAVKPHDADPTILVGSKSKSILLLESHKEGNDVIVVRIPPPGAPGQTVFPLAVNVNPPPVATVPVIGVKKVPDPQGYAGRGAKAQPAGIGFITPVLVDPRVMSRLYVWGPSCRWVIPYPVSPLHSIRMFALGHAERC